MSNQSKYNKNLYNSEKKNKGTSVIQGKVSAIKRRHVPSTLNTLNFKREGLQCDIHIGTKNLNLTGLMDKSSFICEQNHNEGEEVDRTQSDT